MTPAIRRLSELLEQPERPSVDVIADGIQRYLSELAETYGKPSGTWHDPVPERISLCVAESMASDEGRAVLLSILFQMCAQEHLPPHQMDFTLSDELRDAAETIAAAWDKETEQAA